MSDELAFASALELAGLVRRRAVSAVELCDVFLGRIERLNPRLAAYLTVAGDQARSAAAAADRAVAAAGPDDPLPPFAGVPVSVKDLTDTAGIRTTLGTAAFADRVPGADAEVVARMRAAGMVVLGKTNTPELGAAPVTETPAYPPGRNPWDPARSPGGSSGGAAAALAAGLCGLAHGTDGAGSIRIPASLCGVFGCKPSRGRVTHAPRAAELLGQHGPITRTVADAAAWLDAVAGPAPGDAWWAPPPARPFAEQLATRPAVRVAVTTVPFVPGAASTPAHRRAVAETADLLAELGHEVVEAAPPWPFELVVHELAVAGAYLAARAHELPPVETLDPVNRFLVTAGRMVPAHDVLRMQERLLVGARDAVAFFESHDLLLTPTVPVPAPAVGEWTALTSGTDVSAAVAAIATGAAGVPPLLWLAAFTSPWNVTGQPAVSVPAGRDDDGLPVGVQLVGRPAGEAALLAVAAAVEEARPWRAERPPVA